MTFLHREIPLEDVKGLKNGQEIYKSFEGLSYYIDLYNTVINAKEFGIVFSPNDFTKKELSILVFIHKHLEGLRDGGRQDQANFRNASGKKRSQTRS